MCCATWVGGCSDPRQLPPKLSRVPLPEGHSPVPLSVCPTAPLLWHSHPTHVQSPCKPCPGHLRNQGGPLPACSPVQGLYPHDAQRKPQTQRPSPGLCPRIQPILAVQSRRGRSARAGPTQSWKEQSPWSTGCLRSPGSEWLGSGSNSPCILQPSPWHQGQRWPRSPRTFPTKVLPCWGMPGAASPGAAASQARQPPPHPHRLHPAMASWMCWGLPCWGIANGDWPGVPGQGSLALTL